MSDSNGKSPLIPLLTAAAIVALVAYLFTRGTGEDAQSTASTLPKDSAAAKPAVQIAQAIAPTATPAPSPTAVPTAALSPTPRPTPDPHNPENQPRDFLVFDFTKMDSVPNGYLLDGIELTKDGFKLKPAAAGEEDSERKGMLVSAPELLNFPSNAISPLWKEKLPEGTDMFVEIQMSPDAENWGAWQWVTVDDDSVTQMSPTYPNGMPNPNYGYNPGGVFHWGDLQYNYVRYRFTLYSEVEDSPALEGVRFFYQDSTLGDGRIAQPNEIPTEEPTVNPAVSPTPEYITQ